MVNKRRDRGVLTDETGDCWKESGVRTRFQESYTVRIGFPKVQDLKGQNDCQMIWRESF
jgi:hypothetical protein